MEEGLEFKDPVVIKVSEQEFEWLMSRLDEPPRNLPRLRALFEEEKKRREA
jgi:uncharacterized protein (DUF1778 family)